MSYFNKNRKLRGYFPNYTGEWYWIPVYQKVYDGIHEWCWLCFSILDVPDYYFDEE